jgi:biotin carboxyl carrier protein
MMGRMTGQGKFEGVTLAIDGKRVGATIVAPVPGRLLRRHPSLPEAFAHPGQRVAAGATLCLIAIGPVLLPVTMPADGFVLSLAAADGATIGHGEKLAEIVTLAELGSTGVLE